MYRRILNCNKVDTYSVEPRKTLMAKVRIALADDHALLRAGMALLINAQEDMEVVAEAGTSSDAVAAVLRTKPDLLALDLSMPGGGSIKAIEQLAATCPQTKVIVITSHDDPAFLRAAMSAGCAGFLVKTVSDAEMLSAFRTILQGRMVINLPLSGEQRETVLGESSNSVQNPALAKLSEREREVLGQLARGFSNQQIADSLFLSVKTIETYRSRIGEKLGLRNRAEMVALAIKAGLLETTELS